MEVIKSMKVHGKPVKSVDLMGTYGIATHAVIRYTDGSTFTLKVAFDNHGEFGELDFEEESKYAGK